MIGSKVKMKNVTAYANSIGVVIDEFVSTKDESHHLFMIEFDGNISGMYIREEFDYIKKTVSELKDTPWPECSSMCLMLEKCGASECDSCCPEKFEDEKNGKNN